MNKMEGAAMYSAGYRREVVCIAKTKKLSTEIKPSNPKGTQ